MNWPHHWNLLNCDKYPENAHSFCRCVNSRVISSNLLLKALACFCSHFSLCCCRILHFANAKGHAQESNQQIGQDVLVKELEECVQAWHEE